MKDKSNTGIVKKLDKLYKLFPEPEWQLTSSSDKAREKIIDILRNGEVNHPHLLKYQVEDVLHKTLWDSHGHFQE